MSVTGPLHSDHRGVSTHQCDRTSSTMTTGRGPHPQCDQDPPPTVITEGVSTLTSVTGPSSHSDHGEDPTPRV